MCITSNQPAQRFCASRLISLHKAYTWTKFLCITSDQPVQVLVQNKACVFHFWSAFRSFAAGPSCSRIWAYTVLDSDQQLPVTDKP